MSNKVIDYYSWQRKEVYEFVKGGNYISILEIGCGQGNFRKNFPESVIYHGVELSCEAALEASKILDQVWVGSIFDFDEKIKDNFYDLVVCNDVFEHIYDSESFLEVIRRKLNKNGIVVMSIPNVRYIFNLIELLYHKEWRYRDAGILDRTHVRFFTKSSAMRAFYENKFELVCIGGINKYKFNLLKFHDIKLFLMTLILGLDARFQQYVIVAKKSAV